MKILRFASLAAVLALSACSQPTATAPSTPTAAPNAVAAAPAAAVDASASKTWAGTYDINFAADLGSIQGGGAVIWSTDPSVQNVVDLQPSQFMGEAEAYECGPGTNATAAWQHCFFVKVGTRALKGADVPGHPLPVKPWDKSNVKKSGADIEPVILNSLNGMVGADTERLVGSFVKDNKVEYLVLYRLVGGISDGKQSWDLLLIDLKDRAASGIKSFENGWGTGGKK
jgi:hypothetical protein